jgi:hypothetical protein
MIPIHYRLHIPYERRPRLLDRPGTASDEPIKVVQQLDLTVATGWTCAPRRRRPQRHAHVLRRGADGGADYAVHAGGVGVGVER